MFECLSHGELAAAQFADQLIGPKHCCRSRRSRISNSSAQTELMAARTKATMSASKSLLVPLGTPVASWPQK